MAKQHMKRRHGVDGTAYAGGYQYYTLGSPLESNPYRLESNREGWEAGWLDARDEYEEAYASGRLERPKVTCALSQETR